MRSSGLRASGAAPGASPARAVPSTSPPGAASGWLFGPVADLLLGCGVGYSIVLAALCLWGAEVRTGTSPALIPFLTVLIGAPHYGATLLRVYAQRADRRAYALFAVWITAGLALAFAVATHVVWLGSVLLTLYLTWSPWHYTGQNYGLAVLFLRRRGGGSLDAATQRWLQASFALSFALTFVAMHQEQPAAPYAPALYEGYRMLPLGIPGRWAHPALVGLGAAWVATLGIAGVRLLRRLGPAALGPAAALVATQALWFPIPVLVRHAGLLQDIDPFAAANATHYFFYAALAHSVQYVWVTSYFARRSPGFVGLGPYLGRALLAGAAIWTVPALLFAPGMLGRIPFDAGLGALVAAAVNLHHFVLDGAIWKLRDGRIARVLIRSDAGERAAAAGVPARPVARAALLAVGFASLGVMLASSYESEFGLRRAFADGDLARIRTALSRLAWLGRESAHAHLQYGRALAAAGDAAPALRAFQRSAELQPGAEPWIAAADVLERSGQLRAAEAALDRALLASPRLASVAYRSGQLALRRGDRDRARALLARAAEAEPDNALYRLGLERVDARQGDAASKR